MAINLFTKYANKLAEMYTHKSFIKGKTSKEYDWSGTKTVKIMSIQTQELNNYNRNASANRYGTPQELQDMIQELPVTQDKGFSIVIDDGNNSEQGMLKQAGRVLSMQVNEKVVPLIDKYALKQYAEHAGKVVTASAVPTTASIVGHLVDIESSFADDLVPNDNRFVYMCNAYVGLLRQALTECDTITDRMLLKGVVGDFGTLHIVGVPATMMPANVYMLGIQSRSVVLPEKIAKALIQQDPPGISGNLLEGRYLFDAFVIGSHANGVYALVASGNAVANPTVTIASHAATLACSTTGAVIKYTLDGSDPRYSASAETYASAVTMTAGQTIRCAASKAGMYPSGVAEDTDD